jgi:hypothetical protein
VAQVEREQIVEPVVLIREDRRLGCQGLEERVWGQYALLKRISEGENDESHSQLAKLMVGTFCIVPIQRRFEITCPGCPAFATSGL